ncbi:MAG: hypothetical protein CMH54_01515 [Myxococcales bacterium]|nr:hypothetical protein [Myxococcales bacterium]
MVDFSTPVRARVRTVRAMDEGVRLFRFVLVPLAFPKIRLELQTPVPWGVDVDAYEGKKVELMTGTVDDPDTSVENALNISLTRLDDDVQFYVVHERSQLLSPYTGPLRMNRTRRRVGRFSVTGKALCERNFERHSVAVLGVAGEGVRFLRPGEVFSYMTEEEQRAQLELRDCQRERRGTCEDSRKGVWNCQGLVSILPPVSPTK